MKLHTSSAGEGYRRSKRGDERAVSEILGAMFVFALAIAVLSLLQVSAVPADVYATELDHSERTGVAVAGVAEAATRVAATGVPESTTIEAGVRYSPRTLLKNPPTATGVVGTGDPQPVVITNATGLGDAGVYWDGSPHPFETTSLSYTPAYNEYTTAPTVRFESGVVYNEFDDATVVRTALPIVDGDRITLVLVSGEVQLGSSTAVPVDVVPLSAPTQSVAVTDTGGDPITISVPTSLDQATWDELLAGELASGNVQSVVVSGGEATLTLAPNVVYDLRLAHVGIGEAGLPNDDPQYVVAVRGDGASVPAGASQRVVVEVRDGYNNPVSGTPITVATAPSNGTIESVDSRTNEQGRAVVVYRAASTDDTIASDSFVVRATDAPTATRDHTVDIEIQTGSGSSDDGGDAVSDPTDLRVANAIASGPDSDDTEGVRITLVKDTTDALEITHVGVSHDGSATLDDNRGGSGPWTKEFHLEVLAGGDTGDVEAGDHPTDGSLVTLDDGVTMTSGDSTVDVYLTDFEETDGDDVDMTGETLELVVRYTIDGEVREDTFSVTADAPSP